MTGGMEYVDDLARAGFLMTASSAVVIPVAWATSGQMYLMLGDPDALFDAGMEWLDAAQAIQDAVTANNEITNSLGVTGWEGADQDAFAARAADLSRQMMTTMAMCYVVGVALIVAAMALLVAALVIFAMGVGFALHATAILTAMATGVGFLGPVEALIFEAEIYALGCEANLLSLDSTLVTLFNSLAGGVTAALAGVVGLQMTFGNDEALGDLVQGTVDGLGTIAAGLTSVFFRDAIGKGMKPPAGGPLLRLLGIGAVGTNQDPTAPFTDVTDPTR